MPIKKFKPMTPGLRFRTGIDYSEVAPNGPEKSLVRKRKSSGGRNSSGRMTMRQLGGGNKKKYRVIDFKRNKDGVPATVKTIEYDPNRTAFIALLFYADGDKRYILAPKGLKVGDTVLSGEEATADVGNAMVLSQVPLGTSIHAIEMVPGRGAAIARSAGTNGVMVGREGKYAIIKMPSGEMRRILLTCRATIGSTSNPDHFLIVSGKAGRSRWLGRRPHVRGVVMNPVDHPMGGGEGRSSGGHPRSRTGVFAKGQKTRNKKKKSNKLIISKRKK